MELMFDLMILDFHVYSVLVRANKYLDVSGRQSACNDESVPLVEDIDLRLLII